MSHHGLPCWYELTTPDIAAATAFYGGLLDWQVQNAGMEGFDYFLALRDGAMVAGMMEPMAGMPTAWAVYFAVEDCDATCAQAKALGGQVYAGPDDIPQTGRYAVLADPQGAVFAILQPVPGPQSVAFDQAKQGHGNWHELMSPDPVAGLAFYAAIFGWTAGEAMPMGEMGNYQIFGRAGQDLGGMMGLPGPDVPPHWLPYFGVASATAAIAQIEATGGSILHGPQEVPGGAFIAMAQDPQGAHFAVVGGK
ncbi:MAG: VOC family protein [Gemmobacter sp.]|nr:VOC family protein [Gemmobacter sp.]